MSKRISKRVKREVQMEVRTILEMFEDAILEHPVVQRDIHLKIRAERIINNMGDMAQFIERRIERDRRMVKP